jgi:enoyl-CoA hydratase/carnithine racemase
MSSFADGALQLDLDGPVATLSLSRPAARNALNLGMWTALPQALAEVAAQDGLRALIVRGEGGSFASGADISEFAMLFANRDSTLAYGRLIEDATTALADLALPTLAQIDGYCIGAGLAIALACDLRLASADAKLGAPPAKLGLMYSLTDTRRLMLAVGASTAKAMLFTGDLFKAERALAVGLVNEVHAKDQLADAVAAKARHMAALSPWSIRHAKAVAALVQTGATHDTDETRGWFADAVEGPDFAEGLAAFHAKRPPVF